MIRSAVSLLAAAALLLGCDRILPQREAPTLPELAAVEQLYAANGLRGEIRYSGNVIELVIQQPPDQLRRGGPLWARVGPYIYIFSPGTRQLFARHPAVAGVRVITKAGDVEVARAMLVRDRLNGLTWPRALHVLSRALEQGTARPSTMDRLVRFGEEHTDYQYNPDYVPAQE